MQRAVLALAILATALTACGGFLAKGDAEAAVTKFHQQLDAGSFDEMYEQADSLFKDASTRDQFLSMMRTVRFKLGAVVTTEQTEFYSREQVGNINPGSYVSMTYKTVFASGSAVEKFNYRVSTGHVSLVGYNIDNVQLTTK